MLRSIKLLQLGRRFNHNHTPYVHRVEPLREEYNFIKNCIQQPFCKW